MNSTVNYPKYLSAMGKVLFTYIGALFTYELVLLYHSREFTLGIGTIRFDPYLAVLTVCIVLVGSGIEAFRTHPRIRDHLVPGAFGVNERIIIKSTTLVIAIDWYAQSTGEGVSLLATMLFAAILTLSGTAGVLVLLRWGYLGTEDQSKTKQTNIK